MLIKNAQVVTDMIDYRPKWSDLFNGPVVIDLHWLRAVECMNFMLLVPQFVFYLYSLVGDSDTTDRVPWSVGNARFAASFAISLFIIWDRFVGLLSNGTLSMLNWINVWIRNFLFGEPVPYPGIYRKLQIIVHLSLAASATFCHFFGQDIAAILLLGCSMLLNVFTFLLNF